MDTGLPSEVLPETSGHVGVEAAAVADNRVAKRSRVLKSAKIVLDDWSAIDCQIRDVSDTGVKIKVENALSVPHKFRLYFVTDNTLRDVQIAWRHENLLGLAFRGPAKVSTLRKL